MSTDPAVQAATRALMNLPYTAGEHDQAVAAVEAARPIERATALREAAEWIEEAWPVAAEQLMDMADEIGGVQVETDPAMMCDHGPARAAVRTEPEDPPRITMGDLLAPLSDEPVPERSTRPSSIPGRAVRTEPEPDDLLVEPPDNAQPYRDAYQWRRLKAEPVSEPEQ